AWYRAMACLTMTPNPSVPTWLAEIIASDWSKDWSRPWPSVGQLWPTAHDWFVEDQQRDDFHLRVAIPETESGTPSPDLQQLHQAWRLAAQRPDTAPLVMLDLLPQHAMAKNVTGEISAFTVVGQRLNPALTNQLSTILSRPSQRPSDRIPETESGTPSPDLQQLHQAWRLAAQRPDTAPLVMLDLLPQHAMAKNVTGEISAFTVVGQRLNPALTNQLSTILSRPSQRP